MSNAKQKQAALEYNQLLVDDIRKSHEPWTMVDIIAWRSIEQSIAAKYGISVDELQIACDTLEGW